MFMRTKKLKLLYRALVRKINKKFTEFTKYEPVQKQEAIDNTLFLLCRDFDLAEQNEIVLTLIKRLHEKRETEIVRLHKEMETIRTETQKLRKIINE